MLYEEISHHSTLCKEVCSDPRPAILFEFLHTHPSLFPLYWKKQWRINVYSLSAFHSQYYNPLSIQPSVVSFSNRKILIYSVAPCTKGVPRILIVPEAFPCTFPISAAHFLRGSSLWFIQLDNNNFYSSLDYSSVISNMKFLSNHYRADVFIEIFIIIWKPDSYMTLFWKTIIAR